MLESIQQFQVGIIELKHTIHNRQFSEWFEQQFGYFRLQNYSSGKRQWKNPHTPVCRKIKTKYIYKVLASLIWNPKKQQERGEQKWYLTAIF